MKLWRRYGCALVDHDWYFGTDPGTDEPVLVRYCARCGLLEEIPRG